MDVATFKCLKVFVFLCKYANGHRWWRHSVALIIVKNVHPVSQKVDDDYQVPLNPKPMVALPTATRLLGLRVRILPAAWRNVSCERCAVQVETSVTCRSLVQGVLPSVYVLFSVIMWNNNPLHLQVRRSGRTKKSNKKFTQKGYIQVYMMNTL